MSTSYACRWLAACALVAAFIVPALAAEPEPGAAVGVAAWKSVADFTSVPFTVPPVGPSTTTLNRLIWRQFMPIACVLLA